MLNKLILPETDWALPAWSLFLSQLSSTGLLQWQIIVSNILSSTAAGQKNGYLQPKQALVHYLDKAEEFRHSSKGFIIVVTEG